MPKGPQGVKFDPMQIGIMAMVGGALYALFNLLNQQAPWAALGGMTGGACLAAYGYFRKRSPNA
jgi:O-antigen/teichoic acid export membrane protein